MAQTDNGIRIISTAADGTQGNGGSGTYNGGGFITGTDSFSISADGTKVAFMSDASNLVPGDTDGTTDIFVKDLTTGAITLASNLTGAVALTLPSTVPTPFARSLFPSISPDGTKVVFTATPFVDGAPSGPGQIIIKDLVSGTITLLTRSALGGGSPVFSPDGTKIAFFTLTNSTGGGTSRPGGLYLEDLSTGAVTLVSASAQGTPGNGLSSEPTFSPDGTKIAFTSRSTNLGPTTRTGLVTDTDVYVKDLVTGAVTLISADVSGQRGSTLNNTPTESANPAFSPDGTKVAFQSSAANFVPGQQDGSTDVFIKDLTTGAITRVTSLADGTSGGGLGPAFSPDGTKIAFWTATTGYTPDPHASGDSIYIKDLVTGAFTLVSAPVDPAVPGVGNSEDPQFSANGEIVFFSDNDSLVATDTNGHTADVFVKTLSAKPSSPPTAVADSYTTAQGTPLTVAAAAGLLANDTDPNSKPLTAVLLGSPGHGALTLNSDGSFTYTPAAGYSGADTFTYKASEGALQSTTATVSLTVTAAVDHPVIAVDDSYAVSNAFPGADFLTTAAAGVLANDTAQDGGLVALGIVVNGVVQTASVRTGAGGHATVFSDGRLLYDQPFSFDDQGLIRYNGLDSFTYRVRDADGSTADATVTLTVGSGVNHPVIAADDSYAVSNAFPSGDFNASAATGVLANDTSPDGGLVVLGTVVNGVVQTGAVRTAVGGSATVFSDGRLIYDQPFSFDDQGVIRYNGLDSFTYRVRDADGSTADATVTLTVGSGVNHPVTAADDSYAVSNAFPSGDFNASAATGVLANDTSPDGGLVVLGIVVNGVVQTGTVRTAAGGSATVFSDGRLIYDQPFSFDDQGVIRYNGLDSFTYRVRDADGSTADATVTLTVGSGVNHPVTAADDSYAVSNAFPSGDFNASAATGVLANDTSPDGGLVVLGIVVNGVVQTGAMRTAAGGSATVFSDGRLIYDQPFSFDDQGVIRYNGLDSFTYRVRDADGSTADATVTLTVGSGVNHPVTAADDSYAVSNAFPSGDFNASAATGVLANDTSPDGGLVVLGIVVNGVVQTGTVRTAAGGSATVFSDGRLIYDQPFSFDDQGVIRYNGLDSFTYRVRDADGSTADATVTLTVGSGVNHPVTAADDSYAVSNAFPSGDFNASAATGVLANDTSPDGGLVVLGIVVNGVVQTGTVRTAAGGSATVFSDGRLIYDQPFSFDDQGVIRYNGLDSFTYRVRDADGSTADATVTLTVGSGVNHPVTAADDSYAVSNAFPSGDFNASAATGVLANDTSPDGGLVVLGIVVNGVVQTGAMRTAAGGSATVFSDGRLIYDQPFSFDDQGVIRYNGLDSFVYRVRDADGSTADATVTLTVGSGVQTTLTKGVDTVVGTSGDDLINVGTQTLSVGDRIDGGGGTNHLELVGGGIFNLSVPTILTNVQVIDAQEGQAASGAVAATNQSITLRSGLDVTVNVRAAAVNPANPKAATITINGADDASRINLGAGNDIVTVGGVRETVAGGTGNNTIQVTAATIGATIDGGSGHSSLYVLGGGLGVTMGSNITRIATVVLAGSPGPMSFIANGEADLTINDLNKGADTITAGGLNQTMTGGNGSVTFVGFAGGATTFKNSAATMNRDKIANFFAPGSQIDLSDMSYAALQSLRFDAGILHVGDGTHFASVGLTGAVPAGAFVTHQDSGGGTLISYQQ